MYINISLYNYDSMCTDCAMYIVIDEVNLILMDQ